MDMAKQKILQKNKRLEEISAENILLNKSPNKSGKCLPVKSDLYANCQAPNGPS